MAYEKHSEDCEGCFIGTIEKLIDQLVDYPNKRTLERRLLTQLESAHRTVVEISKRNEKEEEI